MLRTERRNPRTRGLDLLPSVDVVRMLVREEVRVPSAVGRAASAIARAADLVARRLDSGGRLWFVGAGTSGRLGVMEAAESPPTFGTSPDRVRAVIAGGWRAFARGIEGAEDDVVAARRAMRGARRGDVVVGITASGVTPFVRAALQAARRAGAVRILVSCGRVPRGLADLRITLDVGPEAIAGSTRLKAGTATKLVLNALTVAAMTRLGKIYRNLMVDVVPMNAKLRARSRRIVAELTGTAPREVERALREARGRVKTAVVMLRRGGTAREAEAILRRHHGFLRAALELG